MMNIDTSYFIYHDLGYEENIITLTMAKKIFFEKYMYLAILLILKGC